MPNMPLRSSKMSALTLINCQLVSLLETLATVKQIGTEYGSQPRLILLSCSYSP